MARIKIEALPAVAELTPEEIEAIFGAGRRTRSLNLECLEDRFLMSAAPVAYLATDPDTVDNGKTLELFFNTSQIKAFPISPGFLINVHNLYNAKALEEMQVSKITPGSMYSRIIDSDLTVWTVGGLNGASLDPTFPIFTGSEVDLVSTAPPLKPPAPPTPPPPLIPTLTWTGLGKTPFWSNPDNWNNPKAGETPASAGVLSLIFPAGAPTTSVDDQPIVKLQSIDIKGPNYQIGSPSFGYEITLTGGLKVEGQNTIYSLPTSLWSKQTINVSSGASLDVKAVLSGPGSLTVQGAGAVTLEQRNTYKGDTILQAGALTIANDGALGGGTLQLNGGELKTPPTPSRGQAIPDVVVNPVTVNANAIIDVGAGGILALIGNVTVAKSSTLTVSGGTLLFGSELLPNPPTLSGPGTLTLTGAGKVTLSEQLAGNVVLTGGISATLGPSLAGGGAIDVNNAQLNASYGEASYHGMVTVEGFGKIIINTKAAKPLGTNVLKLHGGDLETDQTTVLNNPVTLDGVGYYSGSAGVTFAGLFTVGESYSSLQSKSNIPLSFTGGLAEKSAGDDLALGNTGSVTLAGMLGVSRLILGGASVILGNTTAANLPLGSEIDLCEGKLSLGSNLSGGGAINVRGGELYSASSLEGYSGRVTMMSGIIDVEGDVDYYQLGTGTLELDGGQLQSSNGHAYLDNSKVVLGGDVTYLVHTLYFTGSTVTVPNASTSQLNYGTLIFLGQFEGAGVATFVVNGSGAVYVSGHYFYPSQVKVT